MQTHMYILLNLIELCLHPELLYCAYNILKSEEIFYIYEETKRNNNYCYSLEEMLLAFWNKIIENDNIIIYIMIRVKY